VLILLFALLVVLFCSIVHTTSSCTRTGHSGMTGCLTLKCLIDEVLGGGDSEAGGSRVLVVVFLLIGMMRYERLRRASSINTALRYIF
jgi:hypothetical protein